MIGSARNRSSRLGAAAALTLTLGSSASVGAPPTLPAGWLDSQLNERGERCDWHAERVQGAKLLLACGGAGVWVVALAEGGPRFLHSLAASGEVIGFFEEPPGKLWIKVRALEARAFDPDAPLDTARFPDEAPRALAAAAHPAAPLAPPAAPAARARPTPVVLRTGPGRALISLGSADGLNRGDRIELTSERDEDESGMAVGSRKLWAVGAVGDMSEHEAVVVLGLNEEVPVGATALPTLAPLTAGMVAPPRMSGVWELELGLRPFAALQELGGGLLFNASFGRRMGDLHLQAVLEPLGFGDVKGGDSIGVASGSIIASLDQQYYELGLGLGAQTVNDGDFLLQPGSGLALSQLLRVGVQDGFSLSLRSSVVLFHSELAFGGMVALMRIPISRGYWLLFGGGGGALGYGYGEIGVRALLSGNGFAGSRFLNVTAGGGAVFQSAVCDEFFNCNSPVYAGPMLGVSHEWRF